MSGMAHDNRSDMLFFVGLMVHPWSFEGFFMFFYFALVIILYTNFGNDAERKVIFVLLAVDVAARLGLR